MGHLPWTLFSILTWMVGNCLAGNGCPHPPVPAAATYVNVTGGLGEDEWHVRYVCNIGYELFGEERASCTDGDSWPEPDELPQCAINMARYKPSSASSETVGGEARNAVDGVATIVHEAVKHVRITTRCCDDVPLKNVEIRVGNSTTYKDNPLCNWLPGKQKQGDTILKECVNEDTSGRYVSLLMTGSSTVLSLCEVEVFSPMVLGPSSCSKDIDTKDLAIYDDSCFWFVPGIRKDGREVEQLGYTEASETCQGVGYHLADQVDQVAADFIRTRLQASNKAGPGTMVWLGAKRDVEEGPDAWRWVSGKPVSYIFWGSQQPNNYANEQNCAVLDSDLEWRWNDISCKVDAKTVCRGEPSRCFSPPVKPGTWYTGQTTVGSKLEYHCPTGHMPLGQATQVCKASGQWSGQPIECKFVDCGDVKGLLHGGIHIIDGRTTYGARLRYECNKDYTLMHGDEGRVCQEGGWSGSAPTCEYTKCPTPDPVDNSQLKEIPSEAGKNRLGAKVIYTCAPGHVARGSLSRECLLGGEWSGSEPSCEFVDCGNPEELLNGNYELLDGRTTYDAEVTYSCTDDYNVVGETKIRCEANGRWTRARTKCEIIKCRPPRQPSGGRVSGYNYQVHRKVEYSCLPGHLLKGDPVLQCLRSGEWSAEPPRCRYIDCQKIRPIKGGSIEYMNKTTHLGSMAQFSCDKSYKLTGESKVTCGDNGAWSGESPSCSEIRCQLPPKPNNTIVSISSGSSIERLHGTTVIRDRLTSSSYPVGSQLKYRCERGHVLDGRRRVVNRVCTKDGDWTGKEPSCTHVDCGMPDLVDNGEFRLQNNATAFGSMVFYECEVGWKLQGFDKRSCQSSGRWEPEGPKCKETLCPMLEKPANTIMNLTTLRIGGKAVFKCEHGFKLIGDPDINCLSSGSWSAWPPSCVEIDCGEPYTVENSRMFLVNESTLLGSVVEYLCVPGYTREGPFQRTCEISGYWSGQDPKCYIPRKVTPLVGGNSRPYSTGGSPSQGKDKTDNSSIGVWIGVGLGLIVVIGLLVVGIYFYRKQMALQSKPTRDSNANGLGVLGIPSYAVQNYSGQINGQIVGARPPPPIQMYSIDDSPEDHRGPIYDTINDDNSSHSQSTYSQSSDTAYPRSTFTQSTTQNGSPPGPGGGQTNNGYAINDYDVPEGNERPGSRGNSSVGTVTINGIAV